MVDYLKDLNTEQYQAVMADSGPILVIAGAGSGKTRTLTYRVARLIEKGTPPENILLATFTNKAAREMLSRVEKLTGVDVSRLWGGTFHHIANRILRREAHHIGLKKNYVIIDEEDAGQIMSSCMADLEIDPKSDGFPKGNVIRDIFSFALNTEDTIERVISRKYPSLLHATDIVIELFNQYTLKKTETNVLDFDDLLLKLRNLMRGNRNINEKYSEMFRHVLVDEYQDTNSIQADIVDLMARKNRCIMAVGDDSQSIYSFRGANYANIINFPTRYPDVKIYKLETNYRSTPEILYLANRSIEYNELQFQKELRSVRKSGYRPVLAPLRNVSQQANFVAQRIIEHDREGILLKEIAVLYRTHYHSMELQMELTRRGIPFEIRSGIRFFEQAHVKDIAAFLRIIVNPSDETAWKRVLSLYPGIGKLTSDKLWRHIASQKDPLKAVSKEVFLKLVSKKARPGLEKFSKIITQLISSEQRNIPGQMIALILDEGYRQYLQFSYTDYMSREDDLIELAAYASRFADLSEFLSELALFSNMEENKPPAEDPDNRVTLTTVHQAKGLEWAVVFIIWCADGMFPLARALKEEGGLEEERRLFYVASTRAKDLLYFCHPAVDYARGNPAVVSSSRFIQELKPLKGEDAVCPYEHWTVDEY